MISDAKKMMKSQEEAAAKAAAAAETDGIEEDDSTKSKSKAKEEEPEEVKLPFFATTTKSSSTSEKIKSKNASGEIIADGETMAALSKSEPWERRSLSQMFEPESRLDYAGNEVEGADIDGTRSLADRDVAMSIYGLRKKLRTDEFMKIFDSRNPRIGDLD
mmetsp:Transcript_5264/g.8277  ORF Transcript_5264/g.8277 Transcript_5264/m.8277 type:complete len:161 (+) Transcript_5264:700-1182(+)